MALAGSLGAGCGAGEAGASSSSRDAGLWGTPAEAGRDAGRGPDGGHDARPSDAGRDAAADALPKADARGAAHDGGDAGRTPDATVDATTVVDAAYPAVPFAAPQVTNWGGAIAANPLFVPVVFPGETLAAAIATFTAAIGASDYWATVGVEYGVGPASSAPLVTESIAPPVALTDAEIQSFLAQAIATDPRFRPLTARSDAGLDAASPDAAPPSEVIYVLYYPSGTTISAPGLGESCTGFGGYHYSFTPPGASPITYVVVPRCASFNELSGIDFVTSVASHELIEAATDPDIFSPAWVGTDVDHYLWGLVLGDGEVADMCSFLPAANLRPPEASMSAYLVQRVWSNKAAAAYRDPCVPATAGAAYFNTVPEATPVTFVDQGQSYKTLGTQVPVGHTATVTLDLVADAPTGGPWSVSLLDYGAAFNNPVVLDVQLAGATAGVNGQKLEVDITPQSAAPAAFYGLSPYLIYSTRGGVTNLWIGAVSN